MSRITLLVIAALSTVAVAEGKKYELDGHVLKVPHPIAFETGKATLKSESDEAITYVKGYLDDKSAISTLRIEVHSDSTGTEKFNQALTEKRAFAVGKALIAKGAECKRLVAVGFGSAKPVADNDTAENKAKNRRTVFVNAAMRGRAIGGMPLDGGGVVAGDLCAK